MNEELIENFLNREELTLAPIAKRFFSFIVDQFILSMIIMIFLYSTLEPYANDYQKLLMIIQRYTTLILIFNIIYEAVLLSKYGVTPGKLLFKIYVTDYKTGNYMTLKKALLRSFIKYICGAFFYLGSLLAIFTPYKLTLHDMLVGTIVVEIQ